MEAKLIITLDDNCRIFKTLKTAELQELDTYMIQNFENSEEIRHDPEYKEAIRGFLEEYQAYRNTCSRKNNGYIKVVYTDHDGFFKPLKAYYKKDRAKLNRRQVLADIKRRCREDVALLKKVRRDKTFEKWMVPYYRKEIDSGLQRNIPTRYKEAINAWVVGLSQSKNGYFYTRLLDRYTEKYVEEHQSTLEKEIHVKTKSGTIKNIDPFYLDEDVTLSKVDRNKKDYYSIARDDPDELFSLYGLEEIALMEAKQIKKGR